MNAPNRSAQVSSWMGGHRELFRSREGATADDVRRELLIPLAQFLNMIEGADQWGRLLKTSQGGAIPHDILVWKDTEEHFDVFTGAERVEDTQPTWDSKGPIRLGWNFLPVPTVIAQEPEVPPVPPATPESADLRAIVKELESDRTLQAALIRMQIDRIDKLVDRVRDLELKDPPAVPTPEPYVLPELVAVGKFQVGPFSREVRLPVKPA